MSYPVILDHESLIDVELDEPIPIGQDLLRRIEAIGMNPIDTKVRAPNNQSKAKRYSRLQRRRAMDRACCTWPGSRCGVRPLLPAASPRSRSGVVEPLLSLIRQCRLNGIKQTRIIRRHIR